MVSRVKRIEEGLLLRLERIDPNINKAIEQLLEPKAVTKVLQPVTNEVWEQLKPKIERLIDLKLSMFEQEAKRY